MNPKPETFAAGLRRLMAVLCVIVIVPGDAVARLQSPPPQKAASTTSPAPATKIPPDQLDALVAPIALFPDPMLAQTLAASTYPLEIIQLQQWLAKNPGLKDKALADAVAKQTWDPSIQALAGLPDLVKRLGDDIQWTTDLGNAFLAQQNDVMDAVQRMRKKAEGTGNLKSTEQQKVETKVIENKSTIIIEQANPQVVYVPSYDPVVVYGPPVYPYPPIYYPPPGYYAAGLAISFGVGVAMGAMWGGGWGWGCGWGGNNDITINNNNNFNRNTNVGGGNRASQLPARGGAGGVGGVGGAGGVGGVGGAGRPGGVGGAGGAGGVGGVGGVGGAGRPSQLPSGGNTWQHNPQHRGGAPYGDRTTADRFGGSARGDSLANRQASARQQVGRQGGNLASANRGGQGLGGGNRAGGAGVGDRGGPGGGNRAGGAGFGDRGTGGGGADRMGSRDLSRSSGGNRSSFDGGSRGFSGSSARASSSRGGSSMGSRGGGGGRGGGRRR
ncbi:DUF3300 domain-containing protein [Edaphobacter bradus]|uniref:DUF3300 domain-containing protein n=1 Tax=Edaphobacter bradus TaxID=2259016 RepID=UPI0021E0AC96|nr:DUF3300 domain-containing protein [Edaphobacter bradus]